MTLYFVTAWCERPFYAQCEVEAGTPQEAVAKAREAIDDEPAEECDDGYCWDQWRVDTADTEGVLLQLDEDAALRAAAPKLLESLRAILPYAENEAEYLAECHRRDGGLELEPYVEACEAALAAARAIIAKATMETNAASNACGSDLGKGA